MLLWIGQSFTINWVLYKCCFSPFKLHGERQKAKCRPWMRSHSVQKLKCFIILKKTVERDLGEAPTEWGMLGGLEGFLSIAYVDLKKGLGRCQTIPTLYWRLWMHTRRGPDAQLKSTHVALLVSVRGKKERMRRGAPFKQEKLSFAWHCRSLKRSTCNNGHDSTAL